MRELSLPLRDNLQLKKKAVEPVIVLGVEWTPGKETLYSDRKINGLDQPFPILNDMSNFNTSQIVSGSSSTQNAKFVLSDIDGHLEAIVDSADIHKAKATIYLMVQGVDLIDKTVLLQGEINSPLDWNEGDRTLSFDLINAVESVEAGFAIEDGDFPQIPEDLRGKPWPMCFGEVCWMKAVQIRAPRKGFLVEAQGVVDFTLKERLCQARQLICSQKYDPPRTGPEEDAVLFPSLGGNPEDGCLTFRDNKTGSAGCLCPGLPAGQCIPIPSREDRIDKDCLNQRFNEICRLLSRLEQEEDTSNNPFDIRGGENFPQNETIRLNIDGVIFVGVMVVETFTWSEVIHPQRDEINNPPCRKIGEATYGWRDNAPQEGWERTSGNGRTYEFNGTAMGKADCVAGGEPITKVIEGPGESWRYYERFKEGDFIQLNSGTEVYLEDESELLHVANLFGGTITGVAAYRKFNETTLLVNLPTDYYTVSLTDYGSYPDVLEVSLSKPLQTYKDEDWETDIYVKVVSPAGPNPADCIKFLVDTYLATSNITMNMASYTDVKAKLANYPCNFHVKERPSVFKLIGDIAYQSRCAAIIRDGEVVLIYLSEQPTPIRTLTMADIVPESVKITHGETEDLHTRHDVQWEKFEASNNKADDHERRILLKFNIPRYGTFNVDYDYFTQNTFDTILKSVTFWLIRESTTWKRVHFETPMTQIDLDAFDSIALNIPKFPANTTVIIEDASYDAGTNTIKFRCWTPVRAGETDSYLWAWPALQDAKEVFPVQGLDDGREGDALGFTVTPPLDHVLRGGFVANDANITQTAGDRFPSDLDDILPDVNCPDANDSDIAVPLTDFEFTDWKDIANRQDDQFENNQPSGGSGGGTDEDKEKGACDSPHGSGECTYQVKVISITPTAVTTSTPPESNCPSAGPCGCGASGRPCTGPTVTQCHTFGALFSAQRFSDQKKAEAQSLYDNCAYSCGTTNVFQTQGVQAIPGSGGAGAPCESAPGDPDAPGNTAGDGTGEITAPENTT